LLDATRLGRDGTELSQHVESCECCQEALDKITTADEWSDLSPVAAAPAEREPALRRVMEKASGERSAGGQETGPRTTQDLSLGFLTPSTNPDHLGRFGPYEILEVVGQGGMGVVLKAFDPPLHRVVAIKVLDPEIANRATARRRFLREAAAVAPIHHDHVITIHAIAEEKGLPYILMQYVAGESLQERLDAKGPLDVKETLRIGMQVAAGLAAAHAHGVVHRDIKPANILLENGVARVKITDFGLARVNEDGSLSHSEGVIAGTPQYMAPEQARGERVDHRADLFSLGSVLYVMCTGHLPFSASTTLGILHRVVNEGPCPIRELNRDIPDWLASIIRKLHAKDPAKRFQSAAEVEGLLRSHLAHPENSSSSLAPRPSSLKRRRWAIAAALLLCVLGGLGVTEATGVSQVVPTVIRIIQGDGSLIVQVDDPQVRVTVEGDGGLLITGAGPQEVRLRPGSYKLRASKDGKTVREELVNITRGGREVVTVTLEASGQARTAASAAPPVRTPESRFVGHTGPILCTAFSRDGHQVLTGSADMTVRLWDVTTGKAVQQFDGHTDEVTAVGFCYGAAEPLLVISAGADRTVRLWNLKRTQVEKLTGHTGRVRCVASSAQGLIVSGSDDGTVRIWNKTASRSLSGHEGPVASVAVSADGQRIVSGGYDGTVRVWQTSTGKEVHCFRPHADEVYAVALSADGHHALCGGNDKIVRLWDLEKGAEQRRFEGHANAVIAVGFADSNRIVSASSQYQAPDKTLRVWDASTGKEIWSGGGADDDRVGCAAFAADGHVAFTGSSESVPRLWLLSK
jgi:serine/threonine protein kinase/WD40 repeat protein